MAAPPERLAELKQRYKLRSIDEAADAPGRVAAHERRDDGPDTGRRRRARRRPGDGSTTPRSRAFVEARLRARSNLGQAASPTRSRIRSGSRSGSGPPHERSRIRPTAPASSSSPRGSVRRSAFGPRYSRQCDVGSDRQPAATRRPHSSWSPIASSGSRARGTLVRVRHPRRDARSGDGADLAAPPAGRARGRRLDHGRHAGPPRRPRASSPSHTAGPSSSSWSYSPSRWERRLVGSTIATMPVREPQRGPTAGGRAAWPGPARASSSATTSPMSRRRSRGPIARWPRVDRTATTDALDREADRAADDGDGNRSWVIRDVLTRLIPPTPSGCGRSSPGSAAGRRGPRRRPPRRRRPASPTSRVGPPDARATADLTEGASPQ